MTDWLSMDIVELGHQRKLNIDNLKPSKIDILMEGLNQSLAHFNSGGPVWHVPFVNHRHINVIQLKVETILEPI
jgi:hypothetical protein